VLAAKHSHLIKKSVLLAFCFYRISIDQTQKNMVTWGKKWESRLAMGPISDFSQVARSIFTNDYLNSNRMYNEIGDFLLLVPCHSVWILRTGFTCLPQRWQVQRFELVELRLLGKHAKVVGRDLKSLTAM